MPSYDSTTNTKIAALRTLRAAGTTIESYELVKIVWPSPDGTIYYAVTQVDEVASVSPGVTPDVRLIPGAVPAWFLPIEQTAAIGDETVDLTFWDGDGAFSNLMIAHGEGIPATFYYWFPQETLLLEVWNGHLRYESDGDRDRVTVKVVNGFRAADATLPRRAHYRECQSPFPPAAGLTTQAQIDEIGCPYNHYSGIGTTGTSGFTSCPRLSTADCTTRGIDPLFHLSHASAAATVVNNQTHGSRLYSTSAGNETNLKEPVRVVMGTRRLRDMQVLDFRRDLDNNHPDQGWFYAIYEGCEGPIQSFSQAIITVGGASQNAVALHYNYRLGTKGQTAVSDLTTHGYSSTALILYNFGWVNPVNVEPADASASAVVAGLNDIRVYTDATTYTTGYTSNRVWQIMRMLCDKRWGYGLDYSRFDIPTWIAAATWAGTGVRFTDSNGTNWDHVRSDSHVELIGKKVQDQIEDMCLAGRLSRPFLFNGKICIVPLQDESANLSSAPVFTDEGDSRNIIQESGVSTLKLLARKSDLDLPNRIEVTIDDKANDWLETPAPAIEDVAAQYAAGRVVGDGARKVNPKQYNLLGVTDRAQAVKMATSLLDLGQFDEGGLQNNLPITFKVWFIDALDLYASKIVKVTPTRITKYGFTYFRITKLVRNGDLTVTVECQAYNEDYMADFESDYTPPDPTYCVLDSDCPDGFVCIGGNCVPADICLPQVDTVTYEDGVLSIPILPC